MNPIENTLLNHYNSIYSPAKDEIEKSCILTSHYSIGYINYSKTGPWGVIITDDHIYFSIGPDYSISRVSNTLYTFSGVSTCETNCIIPLSMYTPIELFTLDHPKRVYFGFKSKNGELRRCVGYTYKNMDVFEYIHAKLGSFKVYTHNPPLIRHYPSPCGAHTIGGGYGRDILTSNNTNFAFLVHLLKKFIINKVQLPNGELGTEYYSDGNKRGLDTMFFKMFY